MLSKLFFLKNFAAISCGVVMFFVSAEISAQLNGQIRNVENQKYALQVIRDMTRPSIKEFEVKLEDVKGSPYLHEGFQSCRLLSKGEEKGVYLGRYNIYSDEFELSSDEGTVALLKSPYVLIELEGSVFKLESLEEDGKIDQVYVEVLKEVEGIGFFKRYKSVFVPFRKAVTPMETDQQAKFVTVEEYYLKREGGAPEEIRLRKKDVLNFFEDKWVRSYVKEHDPDLKSAEGVIEVLEAYHNRGEGES